MYAVTESENMHQDNISHDDNVLYLIPRSHGKKCNFTKYNLQIATCNLPQVGTSNKT